MCYLRIGIVITLVVLISGRVLAAETPNAEQLRFFEEKVRPILATRCQRCHSEDKQKGSLRLDSSAALLTGGDSGAAIVPGKPDESLLIQAVRYEAFEMPPDGKLADDEIAVLSQWIQAGAFWPAEEKS